MVTDNKYVKLTQREHILKRSETYVGSKTTEETEMYVIENNDLNNIKVIKKKINHNPAFIKLFDEILTNAVKGITELITRSGLVNLDFADVRAVMMDGGVSLI